MILASTWPFCYVNCWWKSSIPLVFVCSFWDAPVAVSSSAELGKTKLAFESAMTVQPTATWHGTPGPRAPQGVELSVELSTYHGWKTWIMTGSWLKIRLIIRRLTHILQKRLETTNQITTWNQVRYARNPTWNNVIGLSMVCPLRTRPLGWLVVDKIEDLRNGSQFIGIVWKEKLNHQRKGSVDRPAIGTCQCVGGTVRHCQIFVRCALLSGKQRPALDQ